MKKYQIKVIWMKNLGEDGEEEETEIGERIYIISEDDVGDERVEISQNMYLKEENIFPNKWYDFFFMMGSLYLVRENNCVSLKAVFEIGNLRHEDYTNINIAINETKKIHVYTYETTFGDEYNEMEDTYSISLSVID